jgi:hypothetical protein
LKKFLLACVLAIVLSVIPLTVLANGNTEIIDNSESESWVQGEDYAVWTSPTIYNLYAGYTGTAPLIIANGRDKARAFYIRLEEPNGLVPGYQALPRECYSWITIEPNIVEASAGETIRVPVTISIPNDVVYANRHDQMAINVADITDQFIRHELQSYWFLTTDPYIPGIEPDPTTPSIAMIAIIAIISIVGGGGAYLLVNKRKHAKR